MELSDLLMSQRRWGRARCRRLLLSLGLPENKHIGTLTPRQRRALVEVLSTKASSTAAPVARSSERRRSCTAYGRGS